MNNNKGFTLVEVMGAIAIIAILLVGGTFAVTSVMEKQKGKIREENIKNIEDAAITYVINKKFYVPVCKKNDGTLLRLTNEQAESAIKNINAKVHSGYSGIRGNFSSLNSSTGLQEYISGNKTTNTAGVLGLLQDSKCYKVISVETLIKEGFIEKADDCNVNSNKQYSVILVYSLGDPADSGGAGQLVALSHPNLCE